MHNYLLNILSVLVSIISLLLDLNFWIKSLKSLRITKRIEITIVRTIHSTPQKMYKTNI